MLYECQKLKNQIEIHFGITLRASKIELLYSTVLSSVCRIPPRNIEISPEKPSVRSKKWRHSGRFGSVKGALQPALCATSVLSTCINMVFRNLPPPQRDWLSHRSKKSRNNYHSMTYGVDLWKFFLEKFKNRTSSSLQNSSNFQQF